MGWIYCIENKINGKKYIGQTKRKNVQNRWDEHIELWQSGKHSKKMQAAYNKYGLDNFKFYSIEEVDFPLLEEREKYYINLFNTIEQGYNVLYGSIGSCKRVYCYDFEGNYLDLYFNSVNEVVKALGIDEALVFNICNGTRYKKSASGKDGKVYRFSYELKDKLPPVVYQKHTVKIAQYTLSGEFIKYWDSIADASETVFNNRRSTQITKVINGYRSSAGGYLWKRIEDGGLL